MFRSGSGTDEPANANIIARLNPHPGGEVNGLRGSGWKRSGGRWRRRITGRSLDSNKNRPSGLEEADHRACRLRWLIGVEIKIIQNAPADGVRVLVLRERLRTPGQRARGLNRTPGRITKACISEGSIVGKARMIERSVKPNVAHGNSTSQGHPEELNRAIQVHIIDGILVVPDAGGWIRYLIGNVPTAIGSQ